MKNDWYYERLTHDEKHGHRIKKRIVCIQTPFQKIEIVDTYDYGRCLFSNGLIQSTELDEFIYHESLIHPALMLHPQPKKTLVAGGGEGAPLREILKHPSIKKIIMVEIDQVMVRCAKQFLKPWHRGAFTNPKAAVYYQDARAYLETTQETFDCIFLDLLDPGESGPAKSLFTTEFYAAVKNRLTEQGIAVIQAGSSNLNMVQGFSSIYQTLQHVFPLVLPYQAHISSYVGPWTYFLASRTLLPDYLDQEAIEKKLLKRKLKSKLRYYSSETHTALFALPPYFKNALKKGKIISDSHLLRLPR
jgi:spermidine synthase